MLGYVNAFEDESYLSLYLDCRYVMAADSVFILFFTCLLSCSPPCRPAFMLVILPGAPLAVFPPALFAFCLILDHACPLSLSPFVRPGWLQSLCWCVRQCHQQYYGYGRQLIKQRRYQLQTSVWAFCSCHVLNAPAWRRAQEKVSVELKMEHGKTLHQWSA